jgi:phenylacetate-coenzyme A ligase PaaK-like adenylate-forming protein
MNRDTYFDRLVSIRREADFEKLALEIFRLQSENNDVYREFMDNLRVNPSMVKSLDQIPFLPVELFKSQAVVTGAGPFGLIFTSSGTSAEEVSRHYLKDASLYEHVFTETFRRFYGNPEDYILLALLPSYLERSGSSLIYMMERLIKKSGSSDSGFYLRDFGKLHDTLKRLRAQEKKTLLFGVTFALLDFAQAFPVEFPNLIVMETGGMKGRRKEMVREEVHEILRCAFRVKEIHSEYGMTELLSQAYSSGNGIFSMPAWMRVIIRDAYDPLLPAGFNHTGGINVIDLANIDSCAFLATQDLGKVYPDFSFEVLGRFDFSEVRGCNLMTD